MSRMDPQWYRPSKMDNNPLAWMIMVDGLVMDARHLPREIQEVAYEKGLIPYIPED
ncbi:MAG: plasmid pRiA4b ORF-3-like protein [Chthonomonadaceae bacterium]|nr:plasmid pRiA4b ORF-3-like protein [Chthonomonadaceae bacterium]